MSNARANEMARKLTESGGLLDYGPDRLRLLIQVWQSLARIDGGDSIDRGEIWLLERLQMYPATC